MERETNWYKRLSNDYEDLKENVNKLSDFLDGDSGKPVSGDKIVLLTLKLEYMALSLNLLEMRIEELKNPQEK
jgi:hypothetical protein